MNIEYFWDLEINCKDGNLMTLVNSAWRFDFKNQKGI